MEVKYLVQELRHYLPERMKLYIHSFCISDMVALCPKDSLAGMLLILVIVS